MFYNNYIDDRTNTITRGIFKDCGALDQSEKIVNGEKITVLKILPPVGELFFYYNDENGKPFALRAKKAPHQTFTFEVELTQKDLQDCENMKNYAELCLWTAAMNECIKRTTNLVSAKTADLTWATHQREIDLTQWKITDNNMPMSERTVLAQNALRSLSVGISKDDFCIFYGAPLALWRSKGYASLFADRVYAHFELMRSQCATVEEALALNFCATEVGNQLASFITNQVFPPMEEGLPKTPEELKMQKERGSYYERVENFHRKLDRDRAAAKKSNSTTFSLIGQGK